MLLATDGVWDFLSGDEVSEIEACLQALQTLLLHGVVFGLKAHLCSVPSAKVLECTSNGGTLEDATAKLLAAAKERWSDYDESYCDTRLERICLIIVSL